MVTNIVFAFTDTAVLYAGSWIINVFLVPKLLYNKQDVLFVVMLLLLFSASSVLIQQVEWYWFMYMESLSKEAQQVFYSFSYQLFNTYLAQFLGCVCMCAYRLLNDHWTSQANVEALQKEKARTELNFLKAQLNPHFLFNSLNSLYAEIDKTNPGARTIVLKFSDMLRYQLYECNVEKIAIEKEIDYLQNYVALEKLRKEDYLQIDFNTKGNLAGFEIAPLLFITFVENAFKYASNHENRKNFIIITLARDKTHIVFECRNSKDKILSRNLVEDSGIGINNVKRRLELLYPGTHQLAIENEEDLFKVSLKIRME